MTTINNQDDSLEALRNNPAWRDAVRAQILGDEPLHLPVRFDAFAREHSKRLDNVENPVQEQSNRLGNVENLIQEQNTRTANLEERVGRVESDTGTLNRQPCRACADTSGAAANFSAIRLGLIWPLALLPKALFSTKAFHLHFSDRLANASYQIVIEGASYRERQSPHRALLEAKGVLDQ